MQSAFHHGYLGVGANVGDIVLNFAGALKRLTLSPRFEMLRTSQPYVSPAWGFDSPHSFLNMVWEVRWLGQLEDLLSLCQQLEADAGRRLDEPGYADRPLDIDLLAFDDRRHESDRLILPHPLAHKRAFVLLPLRELAPELRLAGRPLDDWLAMLPSEQLASCRPGG